MIKIDFIIFLWSHFLQVIVVIHEISVSDIFGFDYRNICFVSLNSHAHTREKKLWESLVSCKTIETPFHKEIITNAEKKDDDCTS
jgi:hypothetical protein